MAPTFSSSSFLYRVFFLAALFLRPARAGAGIEISGTPGIVVGIILMLLMLGCCVGGGIFFMKRRKTRGGAPPQLYRPPGAPGAPLAQDQVPMLAPPQGPFTDAAAVPAGTYPYGQNTGAYPQNTGYNSPYPPAASQSNVTLSAYSPDMHANAPPPGANQNPFSPPPGPPPV